MVEKLKLIISRIRWSLLVKPLILAFIWAEFSPWLFIVFAILFYIMPAVNLKGVLAEFSVFIALSFYLEKGAFSFFALAIMFFLILGIKEFVFIDRPKAREAYVIMALLSFFLPFYWSAIGGNITGFFWEGVFSVFFLFFLLSKIFAEAGRDFGTHNARFFAALTALLSYELSVMVLILPLNPFYQAAMSFMGVIILMEICLDYIQSTITPRHAWFYFAAFFLSATFMLISNNWSI